MKIQLFDFIDQVIDYKQQMRFEIDKTARILDQSFPSIFKKNDAFVSYTSRIKTDNSLKEKIIRDNYMARCDCPEEVFQEIHDIIGCRIECRFMSQEEEIYQELFNHFSHEDAEGYYRADFDPNLQLKLGELQPQSQKNGFSSYRIDGRYLGKQVLNYELQIKSIVNLFWNEIDHRILYKNYNYLVTEEFIRDIMDSILGDLVVIDKQLELVYNHLMSLDQAESLSPDGEIRAIVGRMIEYVYIMPLKSRFGFFFDFRAAIDLMTDFLFAKVKYESRVSYATEFVRIMDHVVDSDFNPLSFGEVITFDPPIDYHNAVTERLGREVERGMNTSIFWNSIIHILFDLQPDVDKSSAFRTFVDYLYFSLIHTIRRAFRTRGLSPADYSDLVDELSELAVDKAGRNLLPDDFIKEGLDGLFQAVVQLLDEPEGGVNQPDKMKQEFMEREIFPLQGKEELRPGDEGGYGENADKTGNDSNDE